MPEPSTPFQRRLRDVPLLSVELNRERKVRLRPIEPSDAERAKLAYARLSPESRRNRFWSAAQSLDDELAVRLTDTDDSRHIAWIAIPASNDAQRDLDSEFPGYGAASLWRNPGAPEQAEFAMTVLDRWQRHGFGTLLFSVLWHEGWMIGIRKFTGYARLENEAMCEWWQSLGGAVHTSLNQHELTLDLIAPDVYATEIGFSLHATDRQVDVASWLATLRKITTETLANE